jgi:hypothetical protein
LTLQEAANFIGDLEALPDIVLDEPEYDAEPMPLETAGDVDRFTY